MTLSTRFTTLFGVTHPVVCGGMTRVGTPGLIAAVAEAGALGFMPAHNSDEVVRILGEGGTYEDVAELVSGARGAIVLETGDLDAGLWCAGQTQGLIHDIPTVADLVARIAADADAAISDMVGLRG